MIKQITVSTGGPGYPYDVVYALKEDDTVWWLAMWEGTNPPPKFNRWMKLPPIPSDTQEETK